MMISWNGRIALALVAALALSACGGGGSGVAPTPVAAAAKGTSHGKGRLVFRIKVPKGRHHRHLVRDRHGKPRYISPATKGLTIDVSGPNSFDLNETVSLLPSAQGCTSSLAGVQCTLTIPNLKACNGSGNCYTAAIETWDDISCPSPTTCTIPDSANELSANETIPFHVAAATANVIAATLDGIPSNVVLVPSPDSSLSGSPYGGFTLSKCGSDRVNVFGVDADGNYILGAGAPVPALQSNSSKLTVATPAPTTPNTFTISRSNANLPLPGSTANLTAAVQPADDVDPADAVTSSPMVMTFDASICGVFTLFNIPTPGSAPLEIALGADRNLWFTEFSGNKIGKITAAGDIPNEYSLGLTPSAGLTGIALGPDNNMWFTESQAGKIGTINPSGVITEYAVGSVNPHGITAGPDGFLWFTEASTTSKIGQMETGGTVDNEYAIAPSSGPQAITTGPDNNLWFVESTGNSIGKITTDGSLTEFPVPTVGSIPTSIATGPDGNLWFTESHGDKIGSIAIGGAIVEYPIAGGLAPQEIVAGADGNMYFTLPSAHAIGQISTDGLGTMVEFSTGLSIGDDPYSISVGPDNNLWFTDSSGAIGRLQ